MNEIDPRWDVAIDLLVDGRPKTEVARRVGCHRNSIANWLRDPAFVRELQRRLNEREVEVRLRRSHQATAYADRVRRLADSALREAEQRPLDRAAQLVVRHWLRMYRQLVDLERDDVV